MTSNEVTRSPLFKAMWKPRTIVLYYHPFKRTVADIQGVQGLPAVTDPPNHGQTTGPILPVSKRITFQYQFFASLSPCHFLSQACQGLSIYHHATDHGLHGFCVVSNIPLIFIVKIGHRTLTLKTKVLGVGPLVGQSVCHYGTELPRRESMK